MNNLVILAYLFGMSELILAFFKRSRKGKVKTRKDKGSLIFLWSVITLGITAGFFLSRPISMFWMGFGTGLIIAGLIIRWVAILQLGKSFTVDVAITDSAVLKTDGIYERLRHPSYLGVLLIVTGFSAAMNSLLSFTVLVIPVFTALVYRIKIEEELLISEFGSQYKNYMLTTKKLIPGIY
jgi:protein-S-isoprenylcysteine O-methyltransferase Ste14